MRFVKAATLFLISTGSVLVSTAEARAQSCNDFSPANQGFEQIQIGNNNNCTPLTGFKATLVVTQDIIVASTTAGHGSSNNGFSMQLNLNAPTSVGTSGPQNYWTQFVIHADTLNPVGGVGAGVDAFTQQQGSTAPCPGVGCIAGTNPTSMGNGGGIVNSAGFLDIPAGTTFTWTLNYDPSSPNNVMSCTFTGTGPNGYTYTTVNSEIIPQAARGPIVSGMLEIVGYNDYSETTFQSGAGTITYTATNLSGAFSDWGCAQNTGTGEDSNMVYANTLTGSNGTYTQNFSASTVANFRNGDCGYPGGGYSLGDWAPGDYKGVCPLGDPMYGVSRVPGQAWTEDIECGISGDTAQCTSCPAQAAYNNTASCYARAVDDYDDRGDTDSGWDWDPGSYKTECKANEYVAGISQAGNGVLTSVLCCPSSVTHKSCDAQVFYNGDSPAFEQPDWDPGYYKGQCQAGQYVAGISTPAYTSVGIPGAAHALLCCSQ
jgi:hypothetical protein